MDPNLFHLDWERTFEVLAAIVIVAFIVERALSLVFENRTLLPLFAGNGLKELISFGVAFAVCRYGNFDAISMILLRESVGVPGELLTAGVVAGGSKASVMLFRDVLKFRSTAYAEYEGLREKGEKPQDAARSVAKGTAPPPAGPTSVPGRE